MPYLNTDDGFPEHEKVDALSDGAVETCACPREWVGVGGTCMCGADNFGEATA